MLSTCFAKSFGMANDYSFLDEGLFRSAYCNSTTPTRMKFYIEGIKCAKCVAKIEALAERNDQLKSIEVDLSHQTAFVELRAKSDSFSRVVEDIHALGFHAIPIETKQDAVEFWNKESRRDLVRLGVAAFCAGNIMMLAFAIYFGLDGELLKLFSWLQFALYLPVVSFVAWPFYVGFWQGIKARNLSIDGPMAIASFLGFAISTWNLSRHNSNIYFDSTSGFLFLILATRYMQKRMRYQYLKYLQPQTLTDLFKARIQTSTGWKWTRADQLQTGQNVKIERNELAPADGILLTPSAIFDFSILNGESLPRKVNEGFAVKAGSRLLTEEAEFRVEATGSGTLLGQLLATLQNTDVKKSESTQFSDRASQILLKTVLSVAAILLIVGSFIDFETYFERAFALIILACPCAMAFGTPLALSFSMKRALEKGFVLKSASILEKLKDIQVVLLDKTGTLTERFWSLTHSSLDSVPLIYQQIILKLESQSVHPLAYSLREIWSNVPSVEGLSVKQIIEIPGQGVQGIIENELWKFRSFEKNNEKWFGLFKEEEMVWQFKLTPQLRKGAWELVQFFRKRNIQVFLLSGDNASETEKIGHVLGVEAKNRLSNQTPEMKAAVVKSMSNSLMIGDGMNDTFALAQASVGLAVHGSVEFALRSASIIYLNDELKPISELFDIAKATRKQILRNLSFALIYNTLGGFAALAGWIHPFTAAVLMPLSSVFILIMTWWGTRK